MCAVNENQNGKANAEKRQRSFKPISVRSRSKNHDTPSLPQKGSAVRALQPECDERR
jgi:hypothetical protein